MPRRKRPRSVPLRENLVTMLGMPGDGDIASGVVYGAVFLASVVVLLVGVLAMGAVVRRRNDLREAQRQRELSRFASENGLMFFPEPSPDYHKVYTMFFPFNQVNQGGARNLVQGRQGEIEWHIFEYHYIDSDDEDLRRLPLIRSRKVGVVVSRVGIPLPEMQIIPAYLLATTAVRNDRIQFESEEFDQTYVVSSTERKLTHALLHPAMIEYLLSLGSRQGPLDQWQLGLDMILIHREGAFKASELGLVMKKIEGFWQRVPEYMRRRSPEGTAR